MDEIANSGKERAEMAAELVKIFRDTDTPMLRKTAQMVEVQEDTIKTQEKTIQALEGLLAAERRVAAKAKKLLADVIEALGETPTDSTP